MVYKLFPTRGLPVPDNTEGFADSYMRTHVVINLDWADRVRILVSGNMHVHTATKTDVPVSRMSSESAVWVDPPFVM